MIDEKKVSLREGQYSALLSCANLEGSTTCQGEYRIWKSNLGTTSPQFLAIFLSSSLQNAFQIFCI